MLVNHAMAASCWRGRQLRQQQYLCSCFWHLVRMFVKGKLFRLARLTSATVQQCNNASCPLIGSSTTNRRSLFWAAGCDIMSFKTVQTIFEKSAYFRFLWTLAKMFLFRTSWTNTTAEPLVASSGHPLIVVVVYTQITVLVHVWSDYRIKRSGWVNIKFWEDCEVSTSVWRGHQESRRAQPHLHSAV